MSSVQYLIGKTLGKYEVLEHIGHGGMAEVYKGRQRQLNRMVAIKVLHPFLADEEGFVVRFQREAHIVATMRHPNIVQVYDFDYDAGLSIYYMVMEYINGPTLRNRIEKGALPPDETARIGAAIATALDYAHQRGMVHRDIKPANIMFLPNGEPVLTDFGIARMLTLSGLTASGAMVGTPAYMAPEIGTGKQATAASDIYSLSVVLYQSVTGHLPFVAETPMGMVMQHINTPPPPPSRYTPEIPPELERVILKGLEKDPSARFNRANEMATALRKVLHQNRAEVIPEPQANGTAEGAKPETAHKEADESRLATNTSSARTGDTRIEIGEKLAERSHRRLSLPLRVATTFMLLLTLIVGSSIWLQNRSGGIFTESNSLPVHTATRALSPTASPSTIPALSPKQSPTPVVTPLHLTPQSQEPSPTPSPPCSLRAKADRVRIEPDSTVAPNTPLIIYVTLRNSGTCNWPPDLQLRFSEGDQLGAPSTFPLRALAPGASIQVLIPITAPTELGDYESVWEVANDSRVIGSRIPINMTIADVPNPTPPSNQVTLLSSPTSVPLTFAGPTLIAWEDQPARGRWSGTIVLRASGGSGSYRYFKDQVQPSTEIPKGKLAFEGRHCEPFPLNIWILSGEELLHWQGEVPYPAPEECP